VNQWKIAAGVALVAGLLLEPRTAHAYLDPSTGSMLLSGLISLVVTAWLAVQTYWHKLLRIFRRGAPSESPAAEEPRDGDAHGA
jgi:hypothetical protein